MELNVKHHVSFRVLWQLQKGKGKGYPTTGYKDPDGSRGIALLFL
jgi:hypothetical protein